jgi:integrase
MAGVSKREATPRLALTRGEAAAALGMSINSFERHVQPELRLVRHGSLRLIPVREIERWLAENADLAVELDRPSREGGPCRCSPSYQAQAWSSRDRKRLTRTFPTLAAAKAWRHDAMIALGRGTLRAGGESVTVRGAWEAWLRGARDGVARTRSGEPYSPSTIRSFERAMRSRVLPAIGARRLSDVRRGDVQRIVERWLSEGLSPSSVRNHLNPLRIVYRRALAHEDVAVNPTSNLQLPANQGKRERFATPTEMAALIDALEEDRALWATAAYAGLRRGELRALPWSEVDFKRGVIRVRWTWDRVAGPKRPKSRAGVRDLPMIALVRRELLAHRMRSGRRSGLVFGPERDRAFDPSTVVARARRSWRQAKLKAIGLGRGRRRRGQERRGRRRRVGNEGTLAWKGPWSRLEGLVTRTRSPVSSGQLAKLAGVTLPGMVGYPVSLSARKKRSPSQSGAVWTSLWPCASLKEMSSVWGEGSPGDGSNPCSLTCRFLRRDWWSERMGVRRKPELRIRSPVREPG